MKHYLKHTVPVPGLLLLFIGAVTFSAYGAYSNLYVFGGPVDDGKWPCGNLVEQGGLLYGMTPYGGISNCGTIFQINPVNGQRSILHRFDSTNGKYPLGSLTVYNDRFYGMTTRGGAHDLGVLFEVQTNGSGFMVRHHFNESADNGSFPWGSLAESNGFLYGMTYFGGMADQGVIFRIRTADWSFTNLHHFTGGAGNGSYPQGDLLIDSGRLYGMTTAGGADGNGVIFSMNLDGSGFTTLHEFTGNEDGANPSGGLLLKDGKLYGMARQGAQSAGVLFSIPPAGGALQVLHTFTGSASDGADPYGSLVQYGSKLYGVTRFGGAHSQGTVFSFGGGYSNVHSFTGGGEPYGTLLRDGDTLYGMAFNEGSNDHGSVFAVTADSNDTAAAWCALQWVDGGALADTVLGDVNAQRIYVRHSAAAGLPDQAHIGCGRTPDVDDATWTWKAMTNYALLESGTDYEYTTTVGRATATGTFYVAVRFIKGFHVYYTKSAFGDWGDWDTALFATNTWTVQPLAPPVNAAATFIDDTHLELTWQRADDKHVLIFRKTGDSPTFTAPQNGVTYYAGSTYDGQGACVYNGSGTALTNTPVSTNTVYHYMLYSENWSYYSAGLHVTSTDDNPTGDDDGDGLPNGWEQRHFGDSTAAQAGDDSDGDGRSNWAEYVAATDPTDSLDVLALDDLVFNSTFGFDFMARTGRVYWVDYNNDPGDPGSTWQNLATNITVGTAQAWPVVDTNLNGVARRAYRIGVRLP
jgi:uncharacterized repeat protein (TIGR03803 family)